MVWQRERLTIRSDADDLWLIMIYYRTELATNYEWATRWVHEGWQRWQDKWNESYTEKEAIEMRRKPPKGQTRVKVQFSTGCDCVLIKGRSTRVKRDWSHTHAIPELRDDHCV